MSRVSHPNKWRKSFIVYSQFRARNLTQFFSITKLAEVFFFLARNKNSQYINSISLMSWINREINRDKGPKNLEIDLKSFTWAGRRKKNDATKLIKVCIPRERKISKARAGNARSRPPLRLRWLIERRQSLAPANQPSWSTNLFLNYFIDHRLLVQANFAGLDPSRKALESSVGISLDNFKSHVELRQKLT